MSAYLEFLSENGQRRFPFIEDQSLTISDEVVLDARGFHRERPDVPPQLQRIVGPESGDEQAQPGHFVFIFQAGKSTSPLQFSFAVPVASSWPLTLTARVIDPHYPSSLLGALRVTFGKATASLNPANVLTLTEALLEPSLVAQLYRTQVDCLRIIHQDGEDEYIGGNVTVHGGYSFDLTQEGQVIRLSPSPGGGELGRYAGATQQAADSKCQGALLSINGKGPNQRRQFFIEGVNGVAVVNLPDQHKIRLVLAAEVLGAVCD